MKTARYRSREFALQAVYQWLVSKNQPALIALDMMQFRGFDKCDPLYFRDLLEGTVKSAEAIEKDLTLCLDRPLERLSPIERAILMIGIAYLPCLISVWVCCCCTIELVVCRSGLRYQIEKYILSVEGLTPKFLANFRWEHMYI